MGKVQNRLPLFLGLVFFQRKTPLMAVMDTARRMGQVEFQEETWQIETVNGGKVKFANGVEWNVPTTMGDGSPDPWYPYFFVPEDKPTYKQCFQAKGEGKYKDRWLAHVSELQGKKVHVLPSRFAYIYLEHTAQRFGFNADKDVMLLYELLRLAQMWCDLRQSGITDTGLRGVQALLETKGAAWGTTSREFEQLADTTLKQARLFKCKDTDGNPLPDIVNPEDVTSGRFRRCLELHTKILKLKIGGER